MTGKNTTYTVSVAPEKAGSRLDRVLADYLPQLSRTRLQALIGAGCVRALDGTPAVEGPSVRVEAGWSYEVDVPPATAATPVPEDLPLVIVHEDEHLIVLDKAAGVVVHPGAGNAGRTLVNALLHHCKGSLAGIGGVERPGIVHRLDKDTSGLLVVAKTDAAHQGLARQFAQHTVERAYHALVWAAPALITGTVDAPIGRSRLHRTKMAVVARNGKAARTRWRVLRRCALRACVIECRLETGRTHQIRVHMAHIGHPVVGDPTYGGRAFGGRAGARTLSPELKGALIRFRRQALHAAVLGFVHPATGETLRFTSPLPADMAALIEAFAHG
ncbi:MAG: RluA family pseudouridine synthase [Proteobacteria bacterium]|nr:RluA family pseudouridine synthase [Pseudomonadota bacterium]